MVKKLFGTGENRKEQIDTALRKFFSAAGNNGGTGCESGHKKISRRPAEKTPGCGPGSHSKC